MFEVKKQEQKPIVLIRTATAHEFSNYEKWKLKNIEEGAQVNKIELIELNTFDGNSALVDVVDKTAKIKLGDLALKSKVTSEDLSAEDIFLIECALDNQAKTE